MLGRIPLNLLNRIESEMEFKITQVRIELIGEPFKQDETKSDRQDGT